MFVSALILKSLRAIFFSVSPSLLPDESNKEDNIMASKDTTRVNNPKGKGSILNPIQTLHQRI